MSFFYTQLFVRPPYPTSSHTGQTIIVTGSNTGLGKEAVKHYIRLGASRIIMGVRSLERGNAAKADIEAATGCSKTLMQVWQLDMGSYRSVQEFAAQVNSKLERVDIVNANAGLARGSFRLVEGNEEMMTVNVVSTMLLAALVMPKLKETAARFKTRPTFCITGSSAHMTSSFPQKAAPEGQLFAQLNDRAFAEAHWGDQYPVSKMLTIFAVRAIAEQSPADKFPVTINTANPGLCHSELAREAPSWGFWLMRQVLARSTEVGSRTVVHGGSAGADTHGKYLSDCHIAEPSPVVTGGREVQDRLWAELVQKLDAIVPGCSRNFSV